MILYLPTYIKSSYQAIVISQMSSLSFRSTHSVLNDPYQLFYITDFLDDETSVNLFRTNKYKYQLLKKYSDRYTVKKRVDYTELKRYTKRGFKVKDLRYNTNRSIKKDDIPDTITSIRFGFSFNKSVRYLPDSITRIMFDYEFNQPVDDLPPNLTHLTFGIRFNQQLDNLPPSLTYLAFGCFFDQPLDNLPEGLTHLYLSRFFNHSLDNLPEGLTHLYLDDWFNQPINKFPKSLTYLRLGYSFKQSLDNLPKNVEVRVQQL